MITPDLFNIYILVFEMNKMLENVCIVQEMKVFF